MDLLVIGEAGHAREIAWLAEDVQRNNAGWRFKGFVAGKADRIGCKVGDWSVVTCDDALAASTTPRALALGIATPALVARVLARFERQSQFEFPNLIHPDVRYRAASVQMGRGNLVCVGTVLTTEIRVGDFNLFNRGCQIGHDCVIGHRNIFNPGAMLSGNVQIGDGCLIGTGAVILQNLSIGDGAVIGAGAVVTHSVPSGVTVAGVPARAMEKS